MKLPNGFGSIHLIDKNAMKTRRKPFRARVVSHYTPEGKAVFHNVGCFATFEDAYDALRDYHKNPFVVENDITVQDIYEKLSNSSYLTLSEKRQKALRSIYNTHVSKVGSVAIKDVKVAHIETVMIHQTLKMQGEIITMFKRIFEWAMKNDIVNKNYADLIKAGEVPYVEGTKRPSKKFTNKTILSVWEDFRNGVKYSAEVLLMLYSGIRVGEIQTLVRHSDDHFRGGIKTEKSKDRVIPIHPDVKEVLPFVNFNASEDAIYRYLKHRYDHKAHDTRHTFVSYMRKNKKHDELLLKEIVGHENGDVTNIYTHFDEEDIIAEIKKLNLPKC